jgi:hypothetical protein
MADPAVEMFAQLLEDLDDASERLAELAERLRKDVTGVALRLVEEAEDASS